MGTAVPTKLKPQLWYSLWVHLWEVYTINFISRVSERDAVVFKSRYMQGVPFVNKRFSCQNGLQKGKELDLGAAPPPHLPRIKLCRLAPSGSHLIMNTQLKWFLHWHSTKVWLICREYSSVYVQCMIIGIVCQAMEQRTRPVGLLL